MARIRSIKPEFWTSEQIVECSPIARLLFIGMWNFCDDGGNHVASVKTLKMEVFPGDDISQNEIASMVEELLDQGLIVQYLVDGKAYWHVTGWSHQKIDRPNYKLPAYPGQVFDEETPDDDCQFDDDSTNDRRTIDERSPPEGKGREGKGSNNPLTPFIDFWDDYPRKVNKAQAIKAWEKLRPDPELAAKIKTALNHAKQSRDWTKDDGAFIPHASTWLNQRRWEDEVVVQIGRSSTLTRDDLEPDWMRVVI